VDLHTATPERTVSPFAPTTRAALATFLIGGPLIYVPVLLAFGGNLWALNPISALLGATMWFLGVVNPGLWLVTWIPTAVAALACGCLLRSMAATAWYARTGRGGVLILGAALCGLTSGIVYLSCSRMALLFMPVGSAQSKITSYAVSPYPAGTRIAMLGLGVPLVIVIGALLGGGLTWAAYSRNRTKSGTARQ
jgi:hypothetical protein